MTATVTTTMVSLALLLVLLAAPTHAAATGDVLAVFSSSKELTVGPTVAAIAVIGVGLVVCVAGYWLIRAVFFACGFAVGAFASASAIEHFFDGYSWVELASWIGFVVGGVIFGLAVVSLYSLSVFIAGAAGGVVLAFAIHASIGYHVDVASGPTLLFLILVIALGIVGGVLSLVLQKPLLIITTSFVGAVAVAWGVGQFAGGFPTGAQFLHTARNDDDWAEDDGVASIPSAWWAYLAGIAVLSIAGMVVQFRKTRDYNYKHSRPTQFRRTAFLRPVPPPSQTVRAQVAYMYATHPPTTERSAIHRV